MATRIISLVLAISFLLSTIGFTAYVIWENNRDDTPSVTIDNTATSQTTDTTTEQENTNVLEGTILTNFTPQADRVTELQIIDSVEGTGDTVVAGANVTVHYTGALVSDGTIFQSSKDLGEPISFGLNGLIQGWQDGIPGMKEGGTRRLVIPAAQAYGETARPGIPADSDLVFDIELISIN